MRSEIKALVNAGKVTPAALGQTLGMAGLNIGKVVVDINNATKAHMGMKVPIIISYDVSSKDYNIIVKLPSVSQLMLKELKLETGAGNREAPAANTTMAKIIEIAKKKNEAVGSNLKTAVLQIIGTCGSMHVNVDGMSYKEIQKAIKAGKYDSQLK